MNSFRLVLISLLLLLLSGCVTSPAAVPVGYQQVSHHGGPENKVLGLAITFGLPITFCLDCVICLVTVWDDDMPEPFFMTRELMQIIRELVR
jgi:hypothetical protein